MNKIFVLDKIYFVPDKSILSRTNLILFQTKNILSGQMDRALLLHWIKVTIILIIAGEYLFMEIWLMRWKLVNSLIQSWQNPINIESAIIKFRPKNGAQKLPFPNLGLKYCKSKWKTVSNQIWGECATWNNSSNGLYLTFVKLCYLR